MQAAARVFLVTGLLVLGGVRIGQAAEVAKADLDKAYTPVVGEMIAGTMTSVLAALKPIDAPMFATYARGGKAVELDIFGSWGSVDKAKEGLEEFRSKGSPVIVGIVKAIYGVDLADEQLTLVYRNRYSGNKEVLRREGGQYIVK